MRHVNPRLVRGNGHAERLRGVAVEFIERNLDRLADVRAKDRERIGESAAVFEMRQRDEILGMVFGDSAKTAVGGERQVKDAGNGVQRDAINDNCALPRR